MKQLKQSLHKYKEGTMLPKRQALRLAYKWIQELKEPRQDAEVIHWFTYLSDLKTIQGAINRATERKKGSEMKTPKTSDQWSYTHYPSREAYVVRPASGSAIYSFYYGSDFTRAAARDAARLTATFRNALAGGSTRRQLLNRWHVISTLLPARYDRLLLQLLALIPDKKP